MKKKKSGPRYIRLTRREYRDEYLKSDHWKDLRAKAFKTHGEKCFKCGKRAHDMHHMRYGGNIYAVAVWDLVPLCRDCHEMVEEAKEMRLIPSEHNQEYVLQVSRKWIDSERKRRREKTFIDAHLHAKILRANAAKLMKISGILKLPMDYIRNRGEGIIITQDTLHHIEWVLARYQARPQKVTKHVRRPPRSMHY